MVIAEDDIEGKLLACALSLNAHTHTGLRFVMSRMGATAAIKPSTSDEKQRQKLLWCVDFFTRGGAAIAHTWLQLPLRIVSLV